MLIHEVFELVSDYLLSESDNYLLEMGMIPSAWVQNLQAALSKNGLLPKVSQKITAALSQRGITLNAQEEAARVAKALQRPDNFQKMLNALSTKDPVASEKFYVMLDRVKKGAVGIPQRAAQPMQAAQPKPQYISKLASPLYR